MMMVFQIRCFLLVFCGIVLISAKDFQPEDFDVECTEKGFHVIITKSKAGNLIFSFIDRSCSAVGNRTHLVASASYNQCGTIKREYDDGTEFSNELFNADRQLKGNKNDDCPHLKLRIACFHRRENPHGVRRRSKRAIIESRIERTTACKKAYAFDQPNRKHVKRFVTCPFILGVGDSIRSDGKLTSISIRRRLKVNGGKTPCRPLSHRGKLHLRMKNYINETYSNGFSSNTQPTGIDWYEDVFYEIMQSGGHKNLKLVPITCYATPNADPKNPMSYVYIANGCPLDPTVKFYLSPQGSVRFSITSFQFQHSDSRSFFSHCNVYVCDDNDQSAQCQKKCQDPVNRLQSRKRRDLYNKQDNFISSRLIRSRRNQQHEIVKPVQKNKEIDVTCLEDRMIIRISKKSSNTFHLRESGCIAMAVSGHRIISSSYQECGTTIQIDDEWLYYTNEIIETPDPNAIIIRGPLLKQTVKCAYRKRSVSVPVQIKLNRKHLVSTGVGFYKVQIDMYKDKQFLVKNSNSIIEIDEKQDMYFEVKIKSTHFKNKLEMHLDTCLGYNREKHGEERQTHIFIRDGCSYNDASVRFYNTIDTSKVRFSVKPFKFGSHSSILINCYVTACSINNMDSKCKEVNKIGRNAYCSNKKQQ